jgi:arsenate reductase-like glutaredoxin family protein
LSQKLPTIAFDIDQSGNVRKADEAEAMYISIQVAHILKEKSFKEELQRIAKEYDFGNIKSLANDQIGFRELLKDWQSMESVIINLIVSAAKFRISAEKKDTERFLKDGIQESEAAELRNLEAEIRNINFEYSQGSLSPEGVKGLTKIERLKEIDNRDDKISSFV